MESEEMKNESSFSGVNDIKLIDFMNEDDFLVDHRFRDSLEDLRLSVTFSDLTEHAKAFNRVNQLKVAKKESVQPQTDEKLSNSGLFEPRIAEKTRPNAFGPSAGVSDLKGLSPINEELKGQGSVVSEDVSAESDFTFETFDGDAFSLERLEDDLFEDVRASIYRSCGTPLYSSASRGSVAAKAGKPNVLSSKKGNGSSQNPKNSGANLKRQSPTVRKSKAMTVSSPNSQSLQHINGGYDSTPTGQTKRALLGYGNVKNRKTGEGLMAHKLSASVDSPGFMNLRTPPTKPSARTATKSTKSPAFARSSCDQFSSTLSSKPLSSHGTRTKGTSSSKIAPSSSISKPPLAYSGRSRSNNQASPVHLLSMSQQSNRSPASSIDRWSSQSSSSTVRATAKLRAGNSEGKLKPKTKKETGSQFTPTKMSLNQHSEGAAKEASPMSVETPDGPKTSGLRMPSPRHGFFDEVSKSFSSFGGTPDSCSKPSGLRMPSPRHGFFDDVTKSISSFGRTPKSSKPSGLLMPSPRHGFFDEEKFMARSPVDTMQFWLSSPDASSDPGASAFMSRNVPANRRNFGSPLAQSLHYTSSTGPQHSVQSKEIDNFSSLSTEIRTSIKTEEKGKKSVVKNQKGKEGRDQEAQNGVVLDTVKLVKDLEADLDLLLESDDQLLCESKENFENEIKNLNIYFEVIDLPETATVLDGQKSNAGEHNESFAGGHFLSGQQQNSPSIGRTPFADKNSSSCHESGSLQLSTELATSFDDLSTFPTWESAKEENL